MKLDNAEVKDKLTQRLRRIEGQVRGVQAMIADERDCREIMQQLAAIHSAVQGASRVFLQEFATNCLVDLDEQGPGASASEARSARAQVVKDMLALLDKTP